MLSQDYHWQSPSRTSYRSTKGDGRLSFWLLLALILSVAVHGVLWVWLDGVRVKEPDSMVLTEVFRIERSTFDPDVLEEWTVPGDTPEPLIEEAQDGTDTALDKSEEAALDELGELSDEELAKFVVNEEARLTPAVDEPENAAIFADNMADVEDLASKLDQEEPDLAALAAELEAFGPSADPTHPTLELPAEMLEEIGGLEGGLAEKGLGAGEDLLPQGYDSLDDALGRAGGGDSGKPILMPTDLLFPFNSAELQESARLSMMKLGTLIMRNPDSNFILQGHTDTYGEGIYNLALSRNRALAIRNWLVESLRLDEGRIKVEALGETQPIVATGSIEEQAINRRVEITVRPRDGGVE